MKKIVVFITVFVLLLAVACLKILFTWKSVTPLKRQIMKNDKVAKILGVSQPDDDRQVADFWLELKNGMRIYFYDVERKLNGKIVYSIFDDFDGLEVLQCKLTEDMRSKVSYPDLKYFGIDSNDLFETIEKSEVLKKQFEALPEMEQKVSYQELGSEFYKAIPGEPIDGIKFFRIKPRK